MLGVAANDFKLFCGIATQAWMFFIFGNSTAKIFAPYSIYKGKAALSADPLLPKFTKLETGDYRVECRGVKMLTFWPAIGERKYDWKKRQKFSLSATEVGSLLNFQRIHVNSSMIHQCYQGTIECSGIGTTITFSSPHKAGSHANSRKLLEFNVGVEFKKAAFSVNSTSSWRIKLM